MLGFEAPYFRTSYFDVLQPKNVHSVFAMLLYYDVGETDASLTVCHGLTVTEAGVLPEPPLRSYCNVTGSSG